MVADGTAVISQNEVTVARVDAVDLRPLISLALNCAVVATIVAALGATILWIAASATGVLARTESFMESIGFRGFHVSAPQVVVGTMMVVGGIALVVATAAVVVGAAYNAFALHGHGLRVRVAVVGVAQNGTQSIEVATTPVVADATMGGSEPAA